MYRSLIDPIVISTLLLIYIHGMINGVFPGYQYLKVWNGFVQRQSILMVPSGEDAKKLIQVKKEEKTDTDTEMETRIEEIFLFWDLQSLEAMKV